MKVDSRRMTVWVSLLVLIALIIYNKFIRVSHVEWGNTIEFKNELGLEIDSLQVFICGVKTSHKAQKDRQGNVRIGGPTQVPEGESSCPVEVKVFSRDSILFLTGDDFACNNSDIDHLYRLTPEGAIYEYKP